MRFLHLEDNPQDAELVAALLGKEWPQLRVELLSSRLDYEAALALGPPDLILSDFSLPSFDGLSALGIARDRWPETPFVFLSGTIGEETAVEALKNGATDYVLKDRMSRLVPAVRRALSQTDEQARRRRAEEELQESRERFRQITENVADLITLLDLDGRCTYMNPAYRSVVGDLKLPAGYDWFGDIHPEDRERVRHDFEETIFTGFGSRDEHRFLLRDGTVRYIESQSSVIRDVHGRIAHVLIVARDVTERRHAEERIREQASLLDKARDAICVAGLDHKITYWNASAQQVFGWSSAEAKGRDFAGLLFPHDAARYSDAVRKLMTDGSWQGELHTTTKESTPVVVESRWTLVTDAKGQPQSILFISTDITERKKLEVQFLRAQRLESIGTLAGGIAHDLNNVLTPVLIAAQMLQLHTKESDAKQLLATIEKSALHGASLIKQVLLFARGADGEQVVLQLRQLVGDMGRLLRETFPRSIEIRTDVDRELAFVRGDATQLNQVLMNLCVNARDAMPDGGSVAITAKNIAPEAEFFRAHPALKPGPYVIVSVVDTGSGIPADAIEHIFDPFFTTKELGKGTGLGLSTALGIIKSHAGVLQVFSEVGKGTRFDLYLPAILTEKPGKTMDTRSPLPRGKGEGVLVIDDEGYIRDVVGSTLRYCGYRAHIAAGGRAGIELYQEHHDEIDVVLVDMMMPGMDGVATMRRLREINPELRLLAMSGMLENELLDKHDDLKGVAFLRKPVTAEGLLSKIAAVLNAVPAR